MRIKKQSVFYASVMFALCSVSLQVMGFLYRIGMSRLIGAQGMGVYGLVMPVSSVVQAFALSGLVLAVTRQSARYRALGQEGCVRAALRYSMIIYALLFSLPAVAVVLLCRPIATGLLGDGRTVAALMVLLPYMLLTGMENLMKAHFQGTNRILPPIVSELSEQAMRMAVVLTLLYLFRGADPGVSAALIVLGMLASELLSVGLLGGWYTAIRRKKEKTAVRARRAECSGVLKELLYAAAPVSLAGVCTNLLASATTVILPRRLVLSGLTQEQALSSFGVMNGMTMPLVMMPAALIFPMVSVLVPRLSQAEAVGDAADVRRKAAKGLHATGIITFGATALLLSLGDDIARLLYNQEGAGDYMASLAFAAFFTFYQIMTGAILNGIGRHKLASFSIVLCAVIHLGFTWVSCALPAVGMAGYVAGDLISALFGAGFNLYFIRKHTALSLRVHNWVIRPLLAALCALFATRLFYQNAGELSSVCTALFGSVLCCGAYLAALRFQGISLRRYLRALQDDTAKPPWDSRPLFHGLLTKHGQ